MQPLRNKQKRNSDFWMKTVGFFLIVSIFPITCEYKEPTTMAECLNLNLLSIFLKQDCYQLHNL